MINFRIVAANALVLSVMIGCGGPAHEYDAIVAGTVTIDGELAESGVVTFHPTGEGKIAIGHIHPDGSYSLRTGQGDMTKMDGGTVKSGDYIVTVSINAPALEGAAVGEGGPPIAGPSLVAARYASKTTSDLKQTVKPGKQIIILELERPEPVASEESESADTEDTSNGASFAEDEATAADDSQTAARESNAERASTSTESPVMDAETAPDANGASPGKEKANL